MFLTPEQLQDLTGRKHRRCQARVLAAMGVPYLVRPDGSLAVLRATVEALAGATLSAPPREPELRL